MKVTGLIDPKGLEPCQHLLSAGWEAPAAGVPGKECRLKILKRSWGVWREERVGRTETKLLFVNPGEGWRL